MKLEECTSLEDIKANFAYRGAEKNPWIIMTVSRIMTNNRNIHDLDDLERVSNESISWLQTNVNESLPTIKGAITQITKGGPIEN